MRKHVKNQLLWLCGLAAVSLYASRNRKSALAVAAVGGWLALAQKHKEESFRGQSVVITGGSRGLGLALARELVIEGALVTLIARDLEELKRAKEKLETFGYGRVHIIECDVTKNESLESAIEEAALQFNGIDLLINNAGTITVGPWETMEQEDFEAQMRLHVYAPMNAIRFALPHLREAKSGKRVVNICSMGGRVAVPHMLPYDTSKFALAGFSQGVGAELAEEGISVTTIYPTLMKTGSPIQAIFKGDHEKEFAWFQTGDVFPGVSMPAEVAARKIVKAARERRWELMPSFLGRVRMVAGAFFPELVAEALAFMSTQLPKGKSRQYKTGAQSRALFDRQLFTKTFVNEAHEVEERWNQFPKTDPKGNMGLH